MHTHQTPDQFPFVIYNSQVLTGKVFSYDKVVKNSPDFQLDFENLARGVGAVKTGSRVGPQTIDVVGHINPVDKVVSSIKENFRHAQFLKDAFSRDDRLLYILANNYKIFLDIDDDFIFNPIGNLTNIVKNRDLSPQISKQIIYGEIDSSLGQPTSGIAISKSEGVDMSEFFADPSRLGGIGFSVYVENPEALQQLHQVQVAIGSDPTGATDFIAFDTSLSPDPNILNYNGKPLRRGWNFVSLPLFFGENPAFGTVGTPDFENLGRFFALQFAVPSSYVSERDKIGLGGIIGFYGDQSFFWDCSVSGQISLGEDWIDNFRDTYQVNLVCLDTRTQSFYTEVTFDEEIPVLPLNIDLELKGIGNQYPVFIFQMTDAVETINIAQTGSQEVLTINENFKNGDVLTIDSFTNRADLNNQPILLNGILPSFREGINRLTLSGLS